MYLILFVCFALPFVGLFFLVTDIARYVVLGLLLGASSVMCALYISGVLIPFFNSTPTGYASDIAPFTEEMLKGISTLLISLYLIKKQNAGIIIKVSCSIGFGFGIFENIFYFVNAHTAADDLSMATAIQRGFSTVLMHGFCTAIMGFAVQKFYKVQKPFFVLIILSALCMESTLHTSYNTLIFSNVYFISTIVPFFLYIFLLIYLYQDKIIKFIKN